MLRVLVLQTIASRRGFVVPDDLLARAAEEGYEAVWDQIREHNLGMRGLLRRSWGLRRR
jgi:hypothetical protein